MTTDKKREELVRAYKACEPLQAVQPVIMQLAKDGKNEEAIMLLADLAQMHETLLGADHRNTMMARYLLCTVGYLGGVKAVAVEGFQELLADCERALGPDHPITHIVRNALRISPV